MRSASVLNVRKAVLCSAIILAGSMFCADAVWGAGRRWAGRSRGPEVPLGDNVIATALQCEKVPVACSGIKGLVLHTRQKGTGWRPAVSALQKEFIRSNGDRVTVLSNQDLADILQAEKPTAVLSAHFLMRQAKEWVVSLTGQVVDGSGASAVGCGESEVVVAMVDHEWLCK